MFSNEEEKLMKYNQNLEQLALNEDKLNEAIEAGFRKAQFDKKKRKKWWLNAAVVAALFFIFFTSIRVSPAFANYIAEIPGMEKIVELIRHDKGIMTAIEHDYYEPIEVSEKKNGMEVVIDGAIVDEHGLVLFYTINSEKKQTEIMMENVVLKNMKGEEVKYGSHSFGTPHYSEKGEKTFNGTIEYFFENPFAERELQLEIELKGDTYNLPFTLKGEIKAKKTYAINQTVTIEGQKIHLVEATVYPLRVGVHVKLDPNNTKKLLEFEDLRLVDGNGETWSKIKNGITKNVLSGDEWLIYLQSNYFKEPEELYLAFNKIQALDKEDSSLVIDTEKEEIIEQPKGNKLRDLTVSTNEIRVNLYTEKEFPYGLFNEVVNGEGKKIDIDSSFWSGYRDEGYAAIGVQIPHLKSQPNPLTLELSFFPEWIYGEEKIRIK
ncbi:hypothetical protein J27TS8_41620 [Robertmurraya siralis]|uniref:DUF4179 domain-containing protein n=2 Tax=Bacillaceae TaxID=186817 RepID=A0A919WM74_9BACI|nr:DUF4179 domain-containing protein [Robertmurraya siralis]PAE18802.1 hypothetical protein CHH80_20060 [Bacillus sp. 7504-2]GIN64169.1 hypothetical protein J27TS8_41620 [Robertmurraya siralis]